MVQAISVILTALALIFGIYQFRSSDNWKRSEFVAAQIKDFYSDNRNRIIITIIEYDDAMVELFTGESKVKMTGEMLLNAINEKDDTNEIVFQIQQDFDHLLKSLSRFNYFLTSEVMRPEELCPDLGFTVALLSGDAREMVLKNSGINIEPFSKAIIEYLRRWREVGATHFLQTMLKTCNFY